MAYPGAPFLFLSMSIVALRIEKGGVIQMAGDTQTTWGHNKIPKVEHNDNSLKSSGKIFQVNGMTFGCAGNVAHIGMLQIFCKTTKPKEMTRDAILEWLVAYKQYVCDKAKVSFNDVSVHGIIASKGKAFVFYDFMNVEPVNRFAAVGSGMFLAMGAMECGASVTEAVKVAIKYDLYCGGSVKNVVIK